jgi:hypothetical protein
MNFQVLKHGKAVGEVGKEWFTWGDSYRVQVLDEEMETILIALGVAIDCVKADDSAASSAGTDLALLFILKRSIRHVSMLPFIFVFSCLFM